VIPRRKEEERKHSDNPKDSCTCTNFVPANNQHQFNATAFIALFSSILSQQVSVFVLEKSKNVSLISMNICNFKSFRSA